MKNVQQIIIKWLEDNGYDGLFCPDAPCACLISDLAPCGQMTFECQAGKKETVGPEVECGCDEEGTEHWHITIARPHPDPKEWVCECGDVCDPSSSQWRFNGTDWEHHHGYPIGHVPATRKPGADQ